MIHEITDSLVDIVGVLVYVHWCMHVPSSFDSTGTSLPAVISLLNRLGRSCEVSYFLEVIILILDDKCYYERVEDIAKLLPAKSTKRTVKKRSILLYQGEIPRQAYIVLSGVFKVYRLGTYGEEQVVGFRTKGDMFPETWLFGKTSGALYYYETMENSEVLTVEKSVLLELFDTQPHIKEQVFDYIVNGYTGLLMQITALEQSRAAEKLLLLMYYLMFRYGKQTVSGTYVVNLHLTHTTLGSLMGLTRETTTMELGRLKRKKIISYSSKGFTIYRRELERQLGDESLATIRLDD